MSVTAVELYEKLKSHLGENDSRALVEYMEDKIRGDIATREDLFNAKAELEEKIQGVREEVWKLRLMIVVVLIAVVVFNPKVLEIMGRILMR